MKSATTSLLSVSIVVSAFYLSASGQETSKASPSLPEDVNKIVSFSCMPCHTSTGGFMSRSKLNFTEWTQYSASKQKEKAEQIYSELKKDKMPPKSARETKPEIIPTKDQIEIIKKWVESFND
jgi:hypothetical protein